MSGCSRRMPSHFKRSNVSRQVNSLQLRLSRNLYRLSSACIIRVGDFWQLFVLVAGFKLACVYLVLEYVRPQSIYMYLDILSWSQFTIIWGCSRCFRERKAWLARNRRRPDCVLHCRGLCIGRRGRPAMWSLSRWDVYLPWFGIDFFLVNAVVGRVRFLLFVLLFLMCSFLCRNTDSDRGRRRIGRYPGGFRAPGSWATREKLGSICAYFS